MTQQEREIAETLAPLIAKAETGEQWAEICRLEAIAMGGPFYPVADDRTAMIRAAAPELLDALIGLVSPRHEHDYGCPCPWCKARAAIAKASPPAA